MDHCSLAPDFPQCLLEMAIWSVCAFFWLSTIFNIFMLINFSRVPKDSWSSRWTWLSILKLHVILLLVMLEVAKSVNEVPHVFSTIPTILIVTHLLSATLILVHKTKRVHTSGIQLLYWSLLSLIHIVKFQSAFKEYQSQVSISSAPKPLILLASTIALMLLQSFIFCWSDIPTPKCLKEPPNKSCPITRCSSLNYILFGWTIPLVLKGYKNPLANTDLWDLISTLKSSTVFTTFSKHYTQHATKNRTIYQNIIKPIWFTSSWSLVFSFFCKFVATLMEFLAPMIMGYIIDFVVNKTIGIERGYVLAFALFLIYVVRTLLLEQFYLHIFKCNANVFTCLNMIIYKKSMRLSSDARNRASTGEIINLMSVDAETIRGMLNYADKLVSSPIQVVVGLVLLWSELGTSIIPGILIITATIPVNWYLTSKSSGFQKDQMRHKDERIRLISEVFSGIEVVKLYGWETSFLEEIKRVRSEEVDVLRKRALYQCGVQFVMNSLPVLVSVVSFSTFVWVGGGLLDAKKAFKCVALFNLLTEPIRDFPLSVSAFVDGWVSLKRVSEFLNEGEVGGGGVQFLERGEVGVEVVNGTFSWGDRGWKLSDINFKVAEGSLTGIVGSVASGKSSVLAAVLGEMDKCSGEVEVRGKVAYAAQTAWIMNTTVRENICFGLPYDSAWYSNVIECCGLGPDIEMLPAGDLTEIGEKGINLSGGQKQRVSLARAVYSQADVLLLDDVLSAVDSQVGRHIFERVLGHGGVLRGRTRILCTHAYQFLPQMDQVLVVDKGRIVEEVSRDRLVSGCSFSSLVSGCDTSGRKVQCNAYDDARRKEKGKLVKDEHVETGGVKSSVLVAFLKAMRVSLVVCFLVAFALSEFLHLSRNLVLGKWTSGAKRDNVTRSEQQEMETFFLEYSVMGVVQSLLLLVGYVILTVSNLNASVHMHNSMVQRIVQAPMSFFNITLLGRIINRFSSDVDSLDKRIPSLVGDLVVNMCKMMGIITAVSIATRGYFLVFVIPLFVIYCVLHRVYSRSLQQLQRMLNVLKSPIYAQFQETYSGTSTVRAYKAEERFMGVLGEKIDSFNQVYFPHWIVRRSLSVILGVMGASVTFVPALFAVVWRDTLDASMVGLSISYAIQFTSVLSGVVKTTCYLQNSFVSVERVLEFMGVEQEEFRGRGDGSSDWPRSGVIDFLDYETTYRVGLSPVLKRISFHVGHGEKIGVVGRTGAGKSTLILGLFRIIEATHGGIHIDGVNIADVGLGRLRKALTVIPQNPVLFSRSLRMNLDPFGDYEDDKIWECLERVHLKTWVDGLDGGLECQVSENLSVGQRQLVCLARAILRKSHVLILDEATASVDSVTDELVQRAIREEFGGCTVLNVAHRVSSVMDSDRILVLGQGEILEFDTPRNLLDDSNSWFYGMARDSGIVDGV